ncbi:MAG: ATP-dependent helicase [Deltaproteobacteria bacterium]|jgi:superfamily I DNA/RNA helicase|nr:MAG: ATP-dependent helicase [Deltaproteobacteria bacterium]
MNQKPHWIQGLDGPARRIAETQDSPLCVLAGPGTGKTFSMMRRVARLLEEGIFPGQILVCTFTRTAATDLKKSLRELQVQGASEVNATTIHAFCFGFLSSARVMEITQRVPRPLLSYEIRFMLEDIRDNEYGAVRACEARLRAFDAAWARLQSEEPGWPLDPIDKQFHATLMSWLRFHKAMLIGELVPQALQFLRNNPESDIKTIFNFILVDEYQDLNRADQVLIDILAEGKSLTVIGDENQSIYSFRFAHPDGVTQFEATHPGTHEEDLTDCYRCPKSVVDLANALIVHNNERVDRSIKPRPENLTGDVQIVQWPSVYDEAKGIAQLIKNEIVRGVVEPGKVLVLAPRRLLGALVREALHRLDIPAHSFFHQEELDGKPSELDESQAQQAFTLLTLLANREDCVALRCWCGFGSASLNHTGWNSIRNHCEQTGEQPYQVLESLTKDRIKLPYTTSIIQRFRLLQQALQRQANLTGTRLVDAIFPDMAEWAVSLRSMCRAIGGDKFDAKILYEHLRTNITQPELPTDVDYVRIMSLHKSKGLSADMVAVVGCVEGLVPHIEDNLPSAQELRQLEEQRRLFYVAITRTRNILIISSFTQIQRREAFKIRAKVTRGVKTHASTIMSRFITDLGSTCPRANRGAQLLKIKGEGKTK